MHGPPSHYVFVYFIHATKYFVMPLDVQREVEEVYLYNQNSLYVSTFESVQWLHIHIILELCYEFHVVDVGLIMALLR